MPSAKGKGKNTDVPTADDWCTSLTLQQNSHRSHHRPHCLHIRTLTHSNYHWTFDGWAEAFPIPDKKADTIVLFLSTIISPSTCPRFMLSNNGTEFKNQLVDDVLKQHGINCIFSTSYHPQCNEKLEVFHKYFKPTLRKLCENDQDIWDQYINQVCISYHVTLHLTKAETPSFLIYGMDPNLPLHQLCSNFSVTLNLDDQTWKCTALCSS